MSFVIVLVALSLGGFLAFSKRLGASSSWQAIVTPLASIMGSGFLVSAPLLAGIAGNVALVFMALLLMLAYLVGGAIRFNIRHFEPIEHAGHGAPQTVALASRVVLAGAYFVSVTYYLQLLAAFALKMLDVEDESVAHIVTTVLLLTIGGIGIWRGLEELGAVEKYAVALNLGMIGALLLALLVHNAKLALGGHWVLPDVAPVLDGHDLRVLLGLLIVVQGFETSRYLGEEFPAEQRVSTMRTAQLVAAGVYLLFIALATVLFRRGLNADVTAIIDMTRPVAVVLPLLLSVAAMGSQFSAAVADTSGAGGLIEDITKQELPARYAYLMILLVTVAITWGTDVNGIIAYASRAFALYYMLQCLVAFLVAREKADLAGRRWKLVLFPCLAVACFAVFTLGLPSE